MRCRGARGMFGYIRTETPQLRVSEWEAYRAVYCGLCRELGHRFGPLARLTLNYDFTFLALVGMALDEEKPEIRTRSCGVNPLHRCPHCESNRRLSDCCDIAVMTLWHKLEDNILDGGFWERIGMRLLRPLLKGKYRRASARFPELAAIFEREMKRQRGLETAGTSELDLACEPTATMLSAVFCSLSGDKTEERVLKRFGYLLGRYVYMADALDDWEKDKEKGNYNPFLMLEEKEAEECKEKALRSLYLTIGEVAAAYELLPVRRFQPILENIVYLGLRSTVDGLRIPRKQRRRKKV